MSVSHNKLGDLEYGLGNVQAAVAEYRQGLAIREQALQHSQQPSPSQQLDVAVSIIKVADACQVTIKYQKIQLDLKMAIIKDCRCMKAASQMMGVTGSIIKGVESCKYHCLLSAV